MRKRAEITVDLVLDGPLFREQRRALLDLQDRHAVLSSEERELIGGLIEMLDHVADIAHDRYDLDCLLEEAD